MIYGSRARLASRRADAGRPPRAGDLRTILSLALACLFLSTAAAAQVRPAAAIRAWPPAIELAGPAANDPDLRAALAADRAWLAGHSADRLTVPDGAEADDAGLRAWLQRAERRLARAAGAPGDDGSAADEPVAGQRDLLSGLRDRWLERGHLAARVRVLDDPSGRRLEVEPGPRYTLRELTVTGDEFPGRESLLAAWLPRAGDRFLPATYLAAAAAVVLGCAERGHPFPIWLTRTLEADRESATVAITAVLVPGPQMTIGPQRTDLPQARGEAFLIRAAGLRSGQPFRESDLRRGRVRLLARDLYTQVDEPLVHLTAAVDTVGILWRATPAERGNRLAVVLGLSRRDQGGTRLSGQVDLDLPNLAGTGRRLRAAWQDDGRLRSRFGFDYLEPLILGMPLDTDLALMNEVQQDAYTSFRVNNRWRLPVVGFWGLEVGVGWDRTTYPEGELASSRRLRGRAGIQRGRGDRARSGWSGAFAVETARRSTSPRPQDDGGPTIGGGQLGRQDVQRLLEVDLAGELWLRAEVSLAARAAFRQIDADERPVPLPELYRFGGANSLRGYREEEFLGETAAWGGVELRLGGVRRSRVYTFVDVGYAERTVRAAADGEFATASATSVGFGLGLLTMAAAGQINLAVGFPGGVDFETAMLHVALLGSF